jgi:hypothetical protein
MKDKETRINFPTGYLSLEQLEGIFATIPLDLTFVNEEDQITFFSNKEKMIFERKMEIIDTSVHSCHAESSYPMLDQMLDDFKTGKSSAHEMWAVQDGKTINIKYLAVRDKEGKYLGILETAEDVTEIRKAEVKERS